MEKQDALTITSMVETRKCIFRMLTFFADCAVQFGHCSVCDCPTCFSSPVQSISDDLNASLATADELSREFSSLLQDISSSGTAGSIAQVTNYTRLNLELHKKSMPFGRLHKSAPKKTYMLIINSIITGSS